MEEITINLVACFNDCSKEYHLQCGGVGAVSRVSIFIELAARSTANILTSKRLCASVS